MANTPSRVNLLGGLSAFLTQNGSLIQKKFDKRGGEVPEAATAQFCGEAWANVVDDFMLATLGSVPVIINTIDTPTITDFVAPGGGELDIDLPAGFRFGIIAFFRALSLEGSIGGNIKVYADQARTDLIYDQDIVDTSVIPPTPSSEFVEQNCFTAISRSGGPVSAGTFYRIRNDGVVSSRYQLQLLGLGFPQI